MKNLIRTLMLTWFVFHCEQESRMAKFLNILPPHTEFRIVCVARNYIEDVFYVFYDTDDEITFK